MCGCIVYICICFALTGSMVDSDLDYEPGELRGSDSASIRCVTLGWSASLSGPCCANLEGIGIGGDVLTWELAPPGGDAGTTP